MNLFVDTSVWSLALRRSSPEKSDQVDRLADALRTGEAVFTTGLVLQELLQGFRGPRAAEQIIARFAALPFLVPDRSDHIAAAELRNDCRRHGVQIGTIDAILAQLCIRHQLVMLSSDLDFAHLAALHPLSLWAR